MGTSRHRPLILHLLPKMQLTPRALATQIAWLLPACLFVVYGALMPVVALPDVTLKAYTYLYMGAVAGSLVPMLAIAISLWTVYSYAYNLTVPIICSMGRGRTVAHLAVGFVAAHVLRLLIRLAHAWARILGSMGREPTWYLSTSPLRALRLGTPAHLALGWLAGTHPTVLYAHKLR